MLLTAAVDAVVACTILPPSVDGKVIYVSSSEGSDTNSGLSADHPVKTIAKGYSLIRDGMPDQLLLKSGDTWNTPLGQLISPGLGQWVKSGRGANEPILISSYGAGDRPLIQLNGEAFGFNMFGAGSYSHVVLSGIHFLNLGGGGVGVRFNVNGSDFLVDNCVIEGFYDNIVVQEPPSGSLSDVRIRRSQILDAYSGNGSGRPQGMYANGVDGLVLEGNVFDHNGWKDQVSPATVFNHNVYTADCPNLTVRGNIFANASSFGLLIQSNATGSVVNPVIENNLFIGGANGLTIGGNSNGGSFQYAVKNATIRGNVFTEVGRSLSGSNQSYGIDLGSVDGALIADNLFVNKGNTGTSFAINMRVTAGYRNVVVTNNIAHNWNNGYVGLGKGPFDGVRITENIFQDTKYGSPVGVIDAPTPPAGVTYADNSYYSSAAESQWFRVQGVATSLGQWIQLSGETGAQAKLVTFVDSTRTAETYGASAGFATPTASDLVMCVRRAGVGQDAYNPTTIINYFKAGFTIRATTGAVPPAPGAVVPAADTDAPTAIAAVPNVTLIENGTYVDNGVLQVCIARGTTGNAVATGTYGTNSGTLWAGCAMDCHAPVPSGSVYLMSSVAGFNSRTSVEILMSDGTVLQRNHMPVSVVAWILGADLPASNDAMQRILQGANAY